jgi:hypothetical protein
MIRSLFATVGALLLMFAFPVMLFAQGAAQPQGGESGSLHLTDTAVQVAIAGAIVWLIEKLKSWHAFPLMAPDTGTVNRWVAIVLSGVATLGIAATFEPDAGKLTITGLTATGIVTGGWEWFKTFVFQELVYRIGVKPSTDTAALQAEIAALRRSLGR